MKVYESPKLEISTGLDVISTSAEVTTGRIEFGSGEARSSVFRLMNFAEVTIDGDTSKYEI